MQALHSCCCSSSQRDRSSTQLFHLQLLDGLRGMAFTPRMALPREKNLTNYFVLDQELALATLRLTLGHERDLPRS
ncbi:hypothetical protein TNCV_945021 [Trichonephila clavipes]|nr:hypothetical protein TNCV_945021 [Trichonephila clavipes]